MVSSTISHIEHDAHVFVHRSAHQSVHNELAELAAIVTVDGVCQTDNHLKIVHVDVPVRTIREQTERAVSVLFVRNTFLYIDFIYRAYHAKHGG